MAFASWWYATKTAGGNPADKKTPTPTEKTAGESKSTDKKTPTPTEKTAGASKSTDMKKTPTPTEKTAGESKPADKKTPSTPTEKTAGESKPADKKTPSTPTEKTAEESKPADKKTPTPTEKTAGESKPADKKTPTPTEKTAEESKPADKKTPPTPTEKTAGESKPADKKTPTPTEVVQGASAPSAACAPPAAAAAEISKVPEKTMKPADPKPKPTPKPEPPKSTQTTKPKTTNTAASSTPTKPTTGKGPTKQDARKPEPEKSKVGGAKEKLISVEKIAAASAPSKSENDDALDLLIDTLGPETGPQSPKATGQGVSSEKDDALDLLIDSLGPEIVPESPKFTGPEVSENITSTYFEELGKRDFTIPPEYRHLLDGKDHGKPITPTEEKTEAMSEDDLLDALTEGFVTSPVKSLEKPGSEEIVSSKVSSVQSSGPGHSPGDSIPDDALDLLSGSLGTRKEDPDENKPIVDVVKEKAKKEHIDRLGDRDDTIPPEYRHLLDGKDEGKPGKPEPVKPKTSLSDDAAIDALSSGLSTCDDTGAASKDKTGKGTASKPATQTTGKTPDASKPTSSSTAPSAPKISKS